MMQKTQAIIDQKKVKAPFAGRLGVRQVNLGEIVTTSTKLVTLTDLHQLYVNFTLPSTMRDKVKLGQEVESRSMRSLAASSRPRSRRSSRRSAPIRA